jgi:hypothetical protein
VTNIERLALVRDSTAQDMMRLLVEVMQPEIKAAATRPGWEQRGAILFSYTIPPFHAAVFKSNTEAEVQWWIDKHQPPTQPFIRYRDIGGQADTLAAAQYAVENFIATLLHLNAYEGP